jgi:hypothetical protein
MTPIRLPSRLAPTTWSSTSAERLMGNWWHSTRHTCGPPVVAETVLTETVLTATVLAEPVPSAR